MNRRPPHRRPAPAPAGPASTLTVTIERLVPGGQGLARTDGAVTFVDGVAAGDVVTVALDGRQGGASRARVLSIVTPSAEREASDVVTADCEIAGACGGCDWLHLTAAARRAWKVELARDSLRRIGRFDDDTMVRVLQSLVVGDEADRVQTGRRRARITVGERGEPTWSVARSHDRVVVPACRALHPLLESAVLAIPQASLPPGTEVRLSVDDRGHVTAAVNRLAAARALVDAGVVVGAVVPRLDGSAFSAEDTGVVGDAILVGEITAGRFDAESDAATFSQATRHGGAAITAAVMAAVDDVIDGARVLELFSGAGHLTLPLAARAAHVSAIEGDGRAVRHLLHNRALIDAGEARIDARVAYIDAALTLPKDVEVVVADPPRTGLVDAAAMLSSLSAGVQRLVMVSCDPATGARDLRAAVAAGFVLERVVPIDAFPRTHHLEWVATLSRPPADDVRTAG